MARRLSRAARVAGMASIAFASASLAQGTDVSGLDYLDSQHLHDAPAGLTEPSGLSPVAGSDHFWAVSDDTGALFQITRSGKIRKSRTISVGIDGLEGVAEDPDHHRILMVAENSAEVVSVAPDSGTIERFPLDAMDGYPRFSDILAAGDANDGLEGITVGPGSLFAIKEKRPRALIEIAPDLSEIRAVTELTAERGFVCAGVDDDTLDVSDITWDPLRQRFWIVSDTGFCVFLVDPGTLTATAFQMPDPPGKSRKVLEHPEGIALTADGSGLMIATDNGKDSRLISLEIR